MVLNPNQIETEIIGADLSQVVDRVTRQYSNFLTAFQKEAIQNSWDAREDRSGGKDWLIKIYPLGGDGETHLIIEDFGTEGMNEERWEAFQSLWRPKKEHLDAGGQGQGKFVLMGGSNIHTLIVESSSDEINYKCKLLINERKSKDDIKYTIRDFIPDAQLLTHKGTKIWVYDVDKDFLKITKSEDFKSSIIESWWQILGPRFNVGIQLFDQKVSLPPLPQIIEENTLLEGFNLDNFGRIKRLVLSFYEKPIPEILQGIRVQRANMMILKLPFEVYDKDYQGRFSGYIEFDDKSNNSLEDQLKDIEKTDHCGFLFESPWKEIKILIKDEAEKFVAKIVPTKKEGKPVNIKNLSQIIQKANQIINDYCPEIIGEGTVVPPIVRKQKLPLRIASLYMNKREVKFGDVVQAMCKIVNDNQRDEKVSLCVELKRLGVRVSQEEYKFKIKAGEPKSIRLSRLELNEDLFEKGKYTFRVTIKENSHDIDSKSTSFYLEIKREPAKRGFIKRLEFHNLETPTRYSILGPGLIKVNFGHKDFVNTYENFESKPNILNRQVGFYIIKICLDEAVNELLRMKLKDSQAPDIDDLIQEMNDLRDNMYYEIYS